MDPPWPPGTFHPGSNNFLSRESLCKFIQVRRIYSALFLAYMGLSSVVLYFISLLLWVLTFWWDKNLRALHQFTCFWGSLYSWSMPGWPLSIEGKEKIDKKEAYVIVSNHQSLLDILMYFRLFVHFKWVSKSEIFRVPFVGWNMYLNRYIGVRRGSMESRNKMLTQCGKAIKSGSSIFMFPEGTRSPDGKLGKFKPTAFQLALKNRISILPMVISGTAHALPKKSLELHGKHPIRIKILDAIPFTSFQDKSTAELTNEVQHLISAELG